MTTSQAKKLEGYFNNYAKNFALTRRHPLVEVQTEVDSTQLDDAVVCPICFNIFFRTALASKDLTLEHVPPLALGGKPKTITCKTCNNLYSRLDDHLRRHEATRPFFEGQPGAILDKVKVTFQGGLGFEGVFERSKDNPEVPIIRPGYELEVEHRVRIQQFIQQSGDFEFMTRVRVPHPNATSVSLLRIAYLWLFSVFGYGLIIHPNYDPVRTQLQNPYTEMLPNLGHLSASNAQIDDRRLGVNIITEPYDILAFMVVFDLKPKNTPVSRHAVILPGPYGPSLNDLSAWIAQKSSSGIEMKTVNVPDQALKDIKITRAFYADEIWRVLSRQS